jgi:hypothetical protein
MLYIYNNTTNRFTPANCLNKQEELKENLRSFLDSSEGSPLMCLWTAPDNPRLSYQDRSMGYGAKPTNKFVVKLPSNILLTFNSAYRLLNETNTKWYLLPLYDGKPKRIGATSGHFTISGNHGQTPGFTVYTVKTYQELQENNHIDDSSADYTLNPNNVNNILIKNIISYFNLETEYTIETLLGWNNQYQRLFKLLKKCNAFISGGSMITEDTSDMDIYIPKDSYSNFIALMYRYKYKLQNSDSPLTDATIAKTNPDIGITYNELTYYTNPNRKPLFDLFKSRLNVKYDAENIFKVVSFINENGKKIDAILCNEHPLYTISHFDLTCNINWFNGELEYYYHDSSENRQCFYNTSNNYTEAQLNTTITRKEKYRSRGYTIIDSNLDTKKIFSDTLVFLTLKGKSFR